MNQINDFNGISTRWGRWPHLGLGIVALALAAGCDTESLVELEDPDLITSSVVQDTSNIEVVRNGVLFEFARAYTGPAANNANPGIVGYSGLFTDEIWYASTFPTMREVDARNIDVNNSGLSTIFRYVQRSRNLADRALDLYNTSSRKGSADHAMVANLSGFSHVFLAENFCSGVPLSTAELTGNLTYGSRKTTDELYNLAIERFNAAAGQPSAGAAQSNLARVGRGRALLGLGRFAEAAAAVSGVPTSFNYVVDFSESASGQNNGVWYNINSERRSSVASGEGVNGVRFFARGPAGTNTIDPRVSVDSAGAGLGTAIQHYRQNKYATRGTDVPLASGVEARLIEAEAALNKGASAAYLPIVNSLRAGMGLAALTDPGSADARVRQFFTERAFFLWLTGHRLGDLRRMVRHYGYQQQQVFPTGATIFGQVYGSDVNFPIPFDETNNPSYAEQGGQCINRNA